MYIMVYNGIFLNNNIDWDFTIGSGLYPKQNNGTVTGQQTQQKGCLLIVLWSNKQTYVI